MSSRQRDQWPQQEAHARAIAAALYGEICGPWTVQETSHTPDEWKCWELVRDADGLRLGLEWSERAGAQAPRLYVALIWPEIPGSNGQRQVLRTPYQQKDPTTKISVDPSKAAAAVALDICRRLLPDASRLHGEAQAKTAQQATAAARDLALRDRLMEASPGSRVSSNSGPMVIYLGPQSHAYTIRVEGGSVRFEAFSVPGNQAIGVLAALVKQDQPEICARCEAGITATQARLSRARAEDAEAWCADCVSAWLTDRTVEMIEKNTVIP